VEHHVARSADDASDGGFLISARAHVRRMPRRALDSRGA
jgi:hypothetical protein